MSSPQVLFRNPSPQLITISEPLHYIPSQFNARRIVGDDSLVVYNSFSGAYSVFPAAIRKRVQTLLSAKGTTEAQEPRLVAYLKERGYLVPKGTDELRRVRHLNGQTQHRNDVMELILLASEECNFRCTYCYEAFKRGTMEEWVRQAIVKWVESRLPRLSRLNIEWFGGEPLLGIDAIREISPTLQTMTREHNVTFTQAMTTNGYLLTPETFALMLEWGITSFQITLDGVPDTHNETRILKEGGGTYNQILANLVAISRHPGNFDIVLRVNFDPNNIQHLPEHIKAMKDQLGGDKRFIMRFYPVAQWGGENDDAIAICGAGAVDIKRELEFASLLQGLPAETRKDWLQPQKDLVICYAARPYNFVVGADGKLMKCTLVLDKKDYNIVGTLLPNGTPDLDLDKMVSWVAPYFEEDEQCKKCFFLPGCQGCSCPLERIENDTRPCPPEKEKIGATLEAVWLAEQIKATGQRPKSGIELSHLLA